MDVSRRFDHSPTTFFKRTLAAQIHGLALLLSLAAMLALLPKARLAGPEHFLACLVFTGTGALLFFTSSLYHFLHDGYAISPSLELLFENLDHYCIYLFIAGTYTPLLLNLVDQPWRTYLLVGIWSIAASGIAYTRLKPHLYPFLQSRAVYTGLFLVMGLLIFFRSAQIYQRISHAQLLLVTGGSIAYALGAVGYATRRPVLAPGLFGYHELWHLMVLFGAGLHFFFIDSFY